MTKLLDEAIEKVRSLPDSEQDMAAAEIMRYLNAVHEPQLSDGQLAEVRRRRAARDPQTLSHAEFRARLRRLDE